MERESVAVTIRRASVADAQEIAVVHVQSWQWAYRGLIPKAHLDALSVERRAEGHAQRLAREAEERTWVAEQNGIIVGFAISGPSQDADAPPGTAEIGAIYLRQEAAGLGVGQTLFAHAVDDLRQRGYTEATLWVLDTNARARRFYERNGWNADGATRNDEWAPGVMLHHVRYRVDLQPILF